MIRWDRSRWKSFARASASATAVLPFLAGCSGTLVNRGSVETTVGRATYHDILTEVPQALRRNGYAIYRNQETRSTIYIETGWQERAPFEDEAAKGVEYARTRFIARARNAGPSVFTLRISAENQVKGLQDSSGEPMDWQTQDWATMPATEMYSAYVGEITMEIKLKVDAGLRTYGVPIRSAGHGAGLLDAGPR
jgi:hypothetical protein